MSFSDYALFVQEKLQIYFMDSLLHELVHMARFSSFKWFMRADAFVNAPSLFCQNRKNRLKNWHTVFCHCIF